MGRPRKETTETQENTVFEKTWYVKGESRKPVYTAEVAAILEEQGWEKE